MVGFNLFFPQMAQIAGSSVNEYIPPSAGSAGGGGGTGNGPFAFHEFSAVVYHHSRI